MNKLGLCLAGGGARGAYQIGVAKRLEELCILSQISAFAGTSIGSVNAVLLATRNVDEALTLWKDIDPSEIHTAESLFKRVMSEKIKIIDNGLFSIEALRGRLWREIDFGQARSKEVYVTVSDSGKAEDSFLGLFKSTYRHFVKKDSQAVYALLSDHNDEDIVDIIMASCSIPIIFPAVTINNRKYYDGGVYDNVPIEPLVQAGCDTIIICSLHLFHFYDLSKYPGVRFIEIRHPHSLGGVLNFDPNHAETCFRLGYEDAKLYFEKNETDL